MFFDTQRVLRIRKTWLRDLNTNLLWDVMPELGLLNTMSYVTSNQFRYILTIEQQAWKR